MICVLEVFLLITWNFSESKTLPAVQYRDGDILIGGLIRVHAHEAVRANAIQSVEVINMIIEQTNRDESILPGIKLGTMIIDTKWNEAHTIEMIVAKFLPKFSTTDCIAANNQSALFAGVVGATSSVITIESARLLQAFAMPQISPWSTNPTLSKKEDFPYFFRNIPSDIHQVELILDFASQQKWNYMSIVFEDTKYGNKASAVFQDIAGKKGICVAASVKIDKNATAKQYEEALKKLKNKNARAVMIFGLTKTARRMLMVAKNSTTAAGDFLWIAPEGWARELPEVDDDIEEYESELEGAIGFAPKSNPVESFEEYFKNLTIGKRNNSALNPWFLEYISAQNQCELKKATGLPNGIKRVCNETEGVNKDTFTPFSLINLVADAVLSFVHSLDAIHRNVCQGNAGLCSKMTEMRGTNELGKRVFETLKNLSIKGINGGSFQFDENQEVPPYFSVYNYKNNHNVLKRRNWIKVGDIHKDGLNGTLLSTVANLSSKVNANRSVCSNDCTKLQVKVLDSEKEECCWKCEQCKRNEFILNHTKCEPCGKRRKPNQELTGCEDMETEYMWWDGHHEIVASALGILGLVCTVLVIALYAKHRASPIVKASGRELCFYTLCGALLTFTNIFAIVTYPTVASCAMLRIILALGPACMYSALLTKTLRVVIIFKSKILSPKAKLFLQPSSQLVLTGLITMVQVFTVILWLIISPARPEFQPSVDDETVFLACNIIVQPSVLIGLVFPFLLILVCTVLATINRNVPTGFNETKFVVFTMYTTTVIWFAFLPIFLTNEKKYKLKVMTLSVCLSLSAYTVLLCLFGQRCFILLFDPERNTQESVMSSKSPKPSSGGQEKGVSVRSTGSVRASAAM